MSLLDVRDIDSSYGRAQVLHGVSMTAEAGQIVAILGRNGAGKSSTLKAIMQLLPPHRGRVTFRDTDVTGWPPYRVARTGIGYVPEDRRVFTQLTVRENLEVGRRPAGPNGPGWTEDALFDLFPNLAERRDAPGRSLSGGEQQMLSVARTLMGNPALVLLDEPSEGLAPVIVSQMARAIARLRDEGLTVVLSEQNLAFARAVSDRALVLDHGTVRFDGSFDALEADPNIRDTYLSVSATSTP
ncbi:High-affinity branched-chain amino acid transport ATP-binding protein LivF [Roseivivax jejudonensis]|uniref:High-affinity branched-chain amino acid transport ATP-binding protein LivF n=1 Tax=Roseivivax jejudonensis TaxID=1529041 RepID=A0A1X6ZJB1_9RHOB|nr:ABC transporter ATP-binding protein [Roseivivax jejudonensis]SLN53230.1 High-affinity branched-chain amino acid transport ATP-binding protein LivF [Roseivivax jejudonensis]